MLRCFTLAARLGFWIVLAAITVLSLLPLQFAVQSGVSDKIEHFVAYAALTAAGRIGYRDRPAPGPWPCRLSPLVSGLKSPNTSFRDG